MEHPLANIDWREQNQRLDDLLNREKITVESMRQGFEAEVMKINLDQDSFVLKRWNKDSKPNISMQYRLLIVMTELALPVPKPVAWGVNKDTDHQVLLTSYEGKPLSKFDVNTFTDFGTLLAKIHNTPVSENDSEYLPKHNFVDYHYWGIKEYPDLHEALEYLMGIASLKQDRIIHGDYHLDNVVEKDRQYRVIDWTNGQLGDRRFDFAKSILFSSIFFASAWKTAAFRKAYLEENPIPEEELEIFEAMVCLKWLLEHRKGYAKQDRIKFQRLQKIMKANALLQKWSIPELPKHKSIQKRKSSMLDPAFQQFPVLQSGNVFLKRIDAGHAEDMYQIYKSRVWSQDRVSVLITHFERDYFKKKAITWGIFSSNYDNRLVGVIHAVFNVKDQRVWFTYELNRSLDIVEIAKEAIKVMLAFMFETINMTRVVIEIEPDNKVVQSELLSIGFIHEGSFRQVPLRKANGKEMVELQMYTFCNALS
ncbi:GNAT family N-acetyltransferase [Paenibacillus baekrokdamisoli]|nr:GNAT family N-acetyltransferase [Paenibacillus baekrokdamisoli]